MSEKYRVSLVGARPGPTGELEAYVMVEVDTLAENPQQATQGALLYAWGQGVDIPSARAISVEWLLVLDAESHQLIADFLPKPGPGLH